VYKSLDVVGARPLQRRQLVRLLELHAQLARLAPGRREVACESAVLQREHAHLVLQLDQRAVLWQMQRRRGVGRARGVHANGLERSVDGECQIVAKAKLRVEMCAR
jgi:hypothetical protein